MKKHITLGLVSIVSLLIFVPSISFAYESTAIATKNEVNVQVHRETRGIEAYNINGYNYFELNELCRMFNWDIQIHENGAIIIKTEFEDKQSLDINDNGELPSKIEVEIVEKELSFNDRVQSICGFTIDGYEYFKLRDIADLATYNANKSAYYLDIIWDEESKIIICKLPKVGNTKSLSDYSLPFSVSYIY